MKTLIVVVGPTAIGKTAFSIELARHLQTEILSCDSRQFYRELDIGVARPSKEELDAARHHFIANRSVTEPYNVYAYEQEALALLEALFERHDIAVAVGGSGLYVDALCQGIAILPDPAPGLRERLQNESLESKQKQLQELDPEYYERVDRQNPVRLQRALEVILTSGRPYSEIVRQSTRPRPFRIVKVGLTDEREVIRERINHRTDVMIGQGLVDEVQGVMSYRHLNTLNTVGYKEIFSYLDGTSSLDASVADIKTHTWQYAKKQLTWLNRYDDIFWTKYEKNKTLLQVFGKLQY